ncbi:ABC transporter permease [Flavobacteriaceae bacterium F89]|uniref:ABC transporter permease n=1 Tax=Cerina litoralis TaxID=2874477 RepID=A0AAE3ES81_9FLAO|nr:FtsX-like permease family protein [Cerina litoralis]MCG2459498.1 ABC transporter permease [Cerina litoralis]
MIRFLLKGIARDKNRSLIPIIIITIGVALTVLLSGFIYGMMGDMVDQNARFETGHVKIMTRAYARDKDQLPNDLALLGVDTLVRSLHKEFPDMQWAERIRFGGLLDVPDAEGNTRAQGPASGMAVDLLSKNSEEIERLNMKSSLVSGAIPKKSGEALIGDDFAKKLNLKIGDTFTFIGSTMNGSMAFQNFKISGTIRFGSAALDKGSIIVDISDAQLMLDMPNGAGEVLGYFKDGVYDDEKAQKVTEQFNAQYAKNTDEFAPVMQRLKEQNNLAGYLDYVDSFTALFVGIFVFAMSIVLWNTGLLGGLRRYQEFGIRLALGEEKGHIYRSLIYEAIIIGIVGSIAGTLLGLGGCYYLQTHGINIGQYMSNSTMLMPSVIRAKITPYLFYVGFIPGLFAMVFGNMLSGIGIYKRETATLFKELEV